MLIRRFEAGGEFLVEFERGEDLISISTPDKPRPGLYKAMSEFVIEAARYFGMPEKWRFCGVSLDPNHSRLEMEIPTAIKHEYARVSLPPVNRGIVYGPGHEVDEGNPRNWFNYRLDMFIRRVADYALGKRGDPRLIEDRDPVIRFPVEMTGAEKAGGPA
jgi:hypothetical protein